MTVTSDFQQIVALFIIFPKSLSVCCFKHSYNYHNINNVKKQVDSECLYSKFTKKHEMLIMAIALQDTLFKLSRYRTESVTVVVTRLRYGWTRVRIPKSAKDFFLLHNVYTGSRVHSASYSVRTGVLYRG